VCHERRNLRVLETPDVGDPQGQREVVERDDRQDVARSTGLEHPAVVRERLGIDYPSLRLDARPFDGEPIRVQS